MTSRELLALAAVGLPMLTAIVILLAPRRWTMPLALVAAPPIAAAGLVLAALTIPETGSTLASTWVVFDAPGGVLIAVIAAVGLTSVLVSRTHLAVVRASLVPARIRERAYFAALYSFWGVLMAVPLAGNLGAAWLVVEATTATSALLVGFSGSRRALEAGWKYLILTSLGLGVALLGIVLLATGLPDAGLAGLSWEALGSYAGATETAVVAYVLLLAGLAAKIGWAPVHNWLPDAHAEAPPPVSAMLSAALLPAVLLIAWRTEIALTPVVGAATAQGMLIAFGLVSLAVAVPFLWRALAWKRLLAYSSLEHMGVIALGLGFATPLALAGVAVHVVGHAVAKGLGFYAATPLLGHEPRASARAVTGVARTEPALGATLGLSLGTLAGIPPSPLFVSEVLIIAGGFSGGRGPAAAAAALLLALGFLGLARALLDTTAGKASAGRAANGAPGLAGVSVLAVGAGIVLLALAAIAPWLAGTDVVEALAT